MSKSLILKVEIKGESYSLPLKINQKRWAEATYHRQNSLVLDAIVCAGLIDTWITEEENDYIKPS